MSRPLGIAAACLAVLLALYAAPAWAAGAEKGFEPLFDGKSLNGWMGAKYEVENGVLVCPAEGGGTLLTENEYSDFVLRLEFKLTPGANNGVGIRAPRAGDPAYVGMEIQILDDNDPQYAHLQPAQYHGSIYGVVAAKRGALKPAGQWNTEEITARGPHIRVTVNGRVTVNAHLNWITDPAIRQAHPGLSRAGGHIGFMGHGSRVEFRNIRLMDLKPDDVPPTGFVALFNGKDISGWKGLVASPPERAKMAPEQLAAAQKVADQRMRDHWAAKSGVLVFDGKGDSLCTAKDYKDFELLVDWKILPAGDSGIYLRGSPQVQIWQNPVGSGGLYNNQKNPSNPLVVADNLIEDWNSFRITMVGEKVTVYLNGKLVVDNVTLENYWERDKPIYRTGQIELQNHGNTLYFKNIYIREISGGGGQ